MSYSKLRERLELSIAKALYDVDSIEQLSKVELADVDRFLEKNIMDIVVPYIENNFERKKR